MKTLSAEELHQEGVRYYNGEGVNKDVPKAIKCFEQAITLGSTKSKRALASILLDDIQIGSSPISIWNAKTDDEKRGVQLYEEAAAEGDELAKVWFVLQYGKMLSLFRLLKGEPAKRRYALAQKYLQEIKQKS